MRPYVLPFFLWCSIVGQVAAQSVAAPEAYAGISLVKRVPLARPFFSGCTGWRDAGGNEFAIVGACKGLYVLDVTIPWNPRTVRFYRDRLPAHVVGSCPFRPSIWREFAIHGGFLYESTFFRPGVRIIALPNGRPMTAEQNTVFGAWDISVDPHRGHLWVFTAGSVPNQQIPTNPVTRVYDINGAFATAPRLIAVWGDGGTTGPKLPAAARMEPGAVPLPAVSPLVGAVHHAAFKQDRIFLTETADVPSRRLSPTRATRGLWEVDTQFFANPPQDPTDWSRASTLTFQRWARTFGPVGLAYLPHNIWIPDAQSTVFATDEGFPQALWVFESPQNLNSQVGYYSSREGVVHDIDGSGLTGYLSAWSSGIEILDLSQPRNLRIERGVDRLAWYDTHPATANSQVGAWGSYHDRYSGEIYVTDTERGLFILRADIGHLNRDVGRRGTPRPGAAPELLRGDAKRGPPRAGRTFPLTVTGLGNGSKVQVYIGTRSIAAPRFIGPNQVRIWVNRIDNGGASWRIEPAVPVLARGGEATVPIPFQAYAGAEESVQYYVQVVEFNATDVPIASSDVTWFGLGKR